MAPRANICGCSFGFVVAKLFTKEDPIYLHKILGLLSLISFFYRYFIVYPTQGNLGFDGSWFDWATMTLHLGLSSSSLIFHVLAQRIYNKPMIIWEEYRLHAIVFTLRSFSVFSFALLFHYTGFGNTVVERVSLWAMVLCHHLVVDEITRRYGPGDAGKTTVRSGIDPKTMPWWKNLILRIYSYYQFCALGSHLIPQARLADAGFNSIIAIQSSAFLMTLFRKGLIENYSHGFWYSSALILSFFHIFRIYSWHYMFPLKVFVAFLLRTKLHISKYVIWTLFCAISLPIVEEAVVEYFHYALMRMNYHNHTMLIKTTAVSLFESATSSSVITRLTDSRDTSTVLAGAVFILALYVWGNGPQQGPPGARRSSIPSPSKVSKPRSRSEKAVSRSD